MEFDRANNGPIGLSQKFEEGFNVDRRAKRPWPADPNGLTAIRSGSGSGDLSWKTGLERGRVNQDRPYGFWSPQHDHFVDVRRRFLIFGDLLKRSGGGDQFRPRYSADFL